MKYYKLLTFALLLKSFSLYSQEKFQCERIDAYHLTSKYNKLKFVGLDRISSNENGYKKEIIPLVINEVLKDHGSKQLCIDTWYKNQHGWSEYKYERFKRNFNGITKQVYIENYDYLEMFYELVDLIMTLYKNQ